MNRAVSNYTESSVDEAVLLNQELSRRQREYRIMENEKKQKCLEMDNLMQKQRAAIKQLEKEETEIDTEMKLAASLKNRKQDNSNTKHIKEFTKSQTDYSSLIQDEKEAIRDVDREIAEIEHKIQEQRKAMGGVHNSHLRHFTTQHTIKVLENRLDKAAREFNGLAADNRKLREDIQHLRSQRGVFDTIFKRLRKDMSHKKREQNLLIEKSALAYDQRDEAEQKMAALKERNAKNFTQYQMEYKELLRQLDHDTSLKSFLLGKAEERWEQAEEQIQQRKQSFEDRCEASAATTLNEYKKAFDDVRQITGATEPDELIEQFVKMEDKNFALFNYVNEVNNQVQKHEDEIKLLDRHIMECFVDSEELLREKSKTIEIESAKLAVAEAAMAKSDSGLAQTNDVMLRLKNGIKTIFSNIGCSSESMAAHLGDQSHVTNVNVLQYLAEIEDKSNDLLQQFMLVNMRCEQDPKALMNLQPIKNTGATVTAPSFEENEPKEQSNPATNEQICGLEDFRRSAIQSCKVKENERKNQAQDKQNNSNQIEKHNKQKKK